MKTSTRFLLLAGAMGLASISPAAADPLTVTISAQNTNSPLGSEGGVDLPSGSLVRFGYFNISPSAVAANFHNLSLLNANFVTLAECEISFFGGQTVLDNAGQLSSYDSGTFISGKDGLFAHNVSLNAEAMGILSKQPYLWILDSSGVDTATQHAIFSDDGWAFTTFGTLGFDITDVDYLDSDDVYLATYGPEQSGTGMGTLNKLQAVPETQAALLLTGTALVLLRRRKSRS